MRREQIERRCKAVRRSDIRDISQGVPTPQRTRFDPALWVEAKCRARFVAGLAQGNTLRIGRLRAFIDIATQRKPLHLLK